MRAGRLLLILLFALLAPGCAGRAASEPDAPIVLSIPLLAPAALDGRPLRVVATTSIIGDVVAQVGGIAIDLTVLMAPGTDPHSYQPAARDLVSVENADVIFVNGWGLEGGLAGELETIGAGVPIVPISAGITPLPAARHAHDAGTGDESTDVDPHVWFEIGSVKTWVENVADVLGTLDPQHAGDYAVNAAAYRDSLDELLTDLEKSLDQIPPENRYLVTNHDSLGYFAHAYGFEILATVIPAASTLAEPSAGDLAGLVAEMEAHGICAIFSETTVSDELARTAAAELDACETVSVLPLYTDSLGLPGSGAETYIGMMTVDVDTIVEGLR